LYWSGSAFRLVNPFTPPDGGVTDSYDIYTTKGTLALTSPNSYAVFGYGQKSFFTVNNLADSNKASVYYDGTLACEDTAAQPGNVGDYTANVAWCLNKTDIFTILDWVSPNKNSPYINLYTTKRVYTKEFAYNVSQAGFDADWNVPADATMELHRGTHRIDTDLSLNWGGNDFSFAMWAGTTQPTNNNFQVYKFFPSTASEYQYVAPCSNRGICNQDTGVCQCFPGYTSDSCGVQNSLAL